jgi:hypothetical protein
MNATDELLCPANALHGKLVPSPAGTPEQAWCGSWYRCAKCGSSMLLPSADLKALYEPAPAQPSLFA